jgi:RNA polymerase sigma factor (sigma-70 family)
MSEIILASILLRVVGVVYSLVLLYRVRDRRFGFLTLMLTLMALRQILTFQAGEGGIDELPGLIVSVLAVLTVYYLSQYVEQEQSIKTRLQETNEQLRGFRKAIQHAGHGIFITDTDGTIEYANPAVEALTGYRPEEVVGRNPRLWKSGEHDEAFYEEMWEEITSGNVWDGEIINRRKNGERCWVDMTIAPILDDGGHIDRFVAVDTDVTERKERERKIRRQNRRLEILNNTNEVLRDINQELVQASTRDSIEQAVCERFADSPPFAFAWIGDVSMVSESLRPRTWAGIDEETLTELVVPDEDGERTPAQRALESRETVLTRDCQGEDAGWGARVVEQDCESLVSIPLSYKETVYGVLEIYASDDRAFDEIEPSVFDELGATIAYAINAIESKRALLQDSVTELEFAVSGADCWFAALSQTLDATFELERVTGDAEDRVVEYFTVAGATGDDVVRAARDRSEVFDVQVVSEQDDQALCRFDVSSACIAATLADFGAVVESMTAQEGAGRVEASVPQSTDVRAVVEAVQRAHPATDLVAQRERERTVQTEAEFRSALKSRLTDRQREALETAYLGGYFEWPRDSTGEEIAEVMGISQSTFLQHLRAAKRKLLAELFDSETPSDAAEALPDGTA